MRRNEVLLEDIRNAALRAARFIEGVTREDFLQDEKTQAAVLHELVVMGEAASRLSDEFRAGHPEVPWKRLTDLRNFYVHVYDAVNYARVWATVTRFVPAVAEAVAALLPPADEAP